MKGSFLIQLQTRALFVFAFFLSSHTNAAWKPELGVSRCHYGLFCFCNKEQTCMCVPVTTVSPHLRSLSFGVLARRDLALFNCCRGCRNAVIHTVVLKRRVYCVCGRETETARLELMTDLGAWFRRGGSLSLQRAGKKKIPVLSQCCSSRACWVFWSPVAWALVF